MKKYRVGIIGCGTIFFSSHAYPLYKIDQAEVKAVCDIKPKALENAKQLFDCDGYEDYRDLLARDDIDVVHILTPHYLHARMAIDAANANKHILTEKPMSITLEEAKNMIKAAKENDVTLGVISQNRYNTASQAIKRALEDGSLGKVIGQRIVLSWTKPTEYYQNSDWRGTWDKEGGSLIIDQSIHVLDLARWFVDDKIVSVEATIANRDHPEIETEDTAEGLIRYQNGVKSVFFATNNFTYNAPVVVETHCENGTALMGFDRAVLTYKNGLERTVLNDPTIVLDEEEFQSFIGKGTGQVARETLQKWGVIMPPIRWKDSPGSWGVTHFAQIKNYYESLSKGVKPDVTGEMAIKTQELICAIYQSAQEKRVVELDE